MGGMNGIMEKEFTSTTPNYYYIMQCIMDQFKSWQPIVSTAVSSAQSGFMLHFQKEYNSTNSVFILTYLSLQLHISATHRKLSSPLRCLKMGVLVQKFGYFTESTP